MMLSPRRKALQQSLCIDADDACPISSSSRVQEERIELAPAYEESELFEIVLRRQRSRLTSPGVKRLTTPSRFSTPQLDNTIEFAGWGSAYTLVLTERDLSQATLRLDAQRAREVELGHWAAASIPAMGVLGSVFYSLPAVVAVSGMLSPISLLIATLLLFFIRPVMAELASALPIHGSAYAYLLNTTTKTLALVGAALQILDYAMNSLQASASASAYIAGEATLPFPDWLLAGLLLLAFALVCCLGAKESASLTLLVAGVHIFTMSALMLVCVVAWAKRGNEVINANWQTLSGETSSHIARRLFDGICLGLLAISGFECSPEYAPLCARDFPKVLRNLHWSAILLIAPLMLCVLALLPIDQVLSGYNVLSLLAESVAGRWLRICIVVDAMAVLCGGIVTGNLSACSLVYRLAEDGVLPGFLQRKLPVTQAPWALQAAFTGVCLIIYAATGASIAAIGRVFSISLLCVLALFPISDLLLKFNRGRLPRSRHASLGLVLLNLPLLVVIFAGNVALDPSTLLYFAPSAAIFIAILLFSRHMLAVLRWAYWAFDSSDLWRKSRWTRHMGATLISWMRSLRRQPVACFVKTDDINTLMRFVLYVQQNEPSAHLKFVHLFEDSEKVPSDFEAFSQILDEAFPQITCVLLFQQSAPLIVHSIDFVFVHATFDPVHVEAICHKLMVPRSSAFIASFGKASFPFSLKESGLRIVIL